MSDWYSRHFGGPQQPAPAPAYQQPHTGLPPTGLRPLLAPQPAQAPAVPMQPGTPALQPQQRPEIIRTKEELAQYAMSWAGGQATQTNPGVCPKCGDPRFIENQHPDAFIRDGNGRRIPAASMCPACGHNGLFEQAQRPVN